MLIIYIELYLLVCTVNTAYISCTFLNRLVSGIMLSSLACTVNILCVSNIACVFGINVIVHLYTCSRTLFLCTVMH